jgi:hypothetical protein
MSKLRILSHLFLVLFISVNAQQPLQHEKKIYMSSDQKLYVNKQAPIYFRLSSSPEANAQSYLLKSEETPKYANPMYFDTEGKNTIRHNVAVDPTTKKIVLPEQDVVFDVFVDGVAPTTHLKLTDATKFIKSGIVYYGKGLNFSFKTNDETSGVEATFISINKANYENISKLQLSLSEEKTYELSYYSVDNVGNTENPKNEKFQVDINAPTTSYEIIGDKKGKVLSAKASIKLTAKDTLSGVSHIVCSINDGPEGNYTSPIPLSVLKDGKSKITYYAVDNVGNKEEAKTITTSTDNAGANADESTFSYYIDKEAPTVSIEIIGDQNKGKYQYISERSSVKINATDEKSGVEKTIYSVNSTQLNNTYTEPFKITSDKVSYIMYASNDYVGNLALAQTQQVYLDKSIPTSKVTFSGNQYTRNDTTFITSNTKVIITSNEIGSGLKSVLYSISNGSVLDYTAPFTVEKEGHQSMSFHAIDNVNNTETAKSCFFIVDNIAPEIFNHFSVKAIGEKTVRDDKYDIYPADITLYIATTDNASGAQSVEYRINGKEAKTVLPLKGFTPGNYEIEVTATDMLKNKSKQIIRFAIEN